MLRNLAQIYLLKISDWKNTGVKKADYDSPGRIWWHHRATYRGWQEWSIFFLQEATVPSGPGCAHCLGFTITLRHTTCGRTPLDEWSASRRDLYLTTHNTHNRQTSTWQHTTLTTDRPLPDNTQHSQQTNIHAPGGIRTHGPSKRAAADRRLRPRGHLDRREW